MLLKLCAILEAATSPAKNPNNKMPPEKQTNGNQTDSTSWVECLPRS